MDVAVDIKQPESRIKRRTLPRWRVEQLVDIALIEPAVSIREPRIDQAQFDLGRPPRSRFARAHSCRRSPALRARSTRRPNRGRSGTKGSMQILGGLTLDLARLIDESLGLGVRLAGAHLVELRVGLESPDCEDSPKALVQSLGEGHGPIDRTVLDVRGVLVTDAMGGGQVLEEHLELDWRGVVLERHRVELNAVVEGRLGGPMQDGAKRLEALSEQLCRLVAYFLGRNVARNPGHDLFDRDLVRGEKAPLARCGVLADEAELDEQTRESPGGAPPGSGCRSRYGPRGAWRGSRSCSEPGWTAA